MTSRQRPAKINVKAVVILLCVVVLLGVGAVVARKVRRQIIASNALTAAKAALEQEDWTEACKQLNHYLNRRPDDLEMLEEYARANTKIRPQEPKHVLTAIGAYRMLLREKTGDAAISHELADLYNMVGQHAEAEHVCRQRLDVDPADPKAQMALGLARFRMHNLDGGTEVLTKLVNAHPEQVQAYALLAAIALKRQDASSQQDAADWLDQAVESNPESAAVWIHRARFRRSEMNKPTRARSDLGQAAMAPVSTAAERLALASEWMATGELDAAGEAIRAAEDASASESAGDDFDAVGFSVEKFGVTAGLALMRKDGEMGIALADDALKDLPAAYGLRFLPWAIDLYLQGGRTEAARSALDSFRQLVIERSDPGGQLSDLTTVVEAAVLAAEGHPYQVIELLELFVAQNPESSIAWKLLWRAFDRTQQLRRSIAALESYLDLNRNDVEALSAAARAYGNRSPAKAAEYASRALRIRSDDSGTKLLSLEARAAEAGSAQQLSAINAELEPILAADPRNQGAHALRMSVLLMLELTEEAEAALRLAETQSDDPVAATLMRLTFLARSGQSEEAEQLCRQAIDDHPESATLRITLARLQIYSGAFDDARKTLEDALEALQGADRTRAEFALVEHLIMQGESADAVEHLRRIVSRDSENLRARILLLDREEIAKDPEESRRLVGELRRIEGDHGLRWRLEDVRLQLRHDDWQGDKDAIVRTLQEGLRRDPGWSKAAVILGLVYQALGRGDEAVQTYRNAYEANPLGASIGLVDRLVSSLISRGQFPEAQTILSRFPEDVARLRMHRVGVAIGQEDFESAIEGLERLVEENPTDAESIVRLALMVYMESEDAVESLSLLDRAASAVPGLQYVTRSRVYILHKEGRDKEALEVIDEEVGRRNDRESYLFRAAFCESVGHMDRAKSDYEHAATMTPSASEGFVALGDFLTRRGRGEEALEAWREASSRDPDNVGIEIRVIETLLAGPEEPKRADGRRRLEALLQRAPDDARVLYVSARAEIATGSSAAIERAERSLEDAIEAHPQFAAAHLELIRIAQRSGRPGKFEERLRAARRSGVQSPEIDIAEAAFEADRGNLLPAESLTRSVIDRYSGNVAARLLRAQIKLHAGETDAANSLVAEALEIDPENTQAIITWAGILLSQGEEGEAINLLTRHCAENEGPRTVPALLRLAALHIRTQDLDAAQLDVAKAERLVPGSVDVVLAQIDLLAAREQFADISTLAGRETSAGGGRLRIITRTAAALSGAPEEKYHAQGLELFQAALTATPWNLDLMFAVAQLSYRAKDVSTAVDTYRTLLEREPFHVRALNDLAWILAIEMDEPDEGLRLASKGLDRAPDNSNLLDTRGVIHFRLGHYDLSRKDFEACVDLPSVAPSTLARTLFHLARTLAAAGDHPSARSRLDEARGIDESEDVFTDEEHEEIAKLSETISK